MENSNAKFQIVNKKSESKSSTNPQIRIQKKKFFCSLITIHEI